MNIEQKVFEILSEMSSITVDDTSLELTTDIGLDSMNMIMLLIEIEDTFDIRLDESDMNPFDLITVKDIIKLVEKYEVKNEEE